MIAPAELARLTQSSTPHALLDLREKAAYERGHIYRATSLPRRLLEFRLPTLVPARATPLVVCDEDGRLAALALPTLGEMGYTDVRVLAGGLTAWRAEGRPLVEGINVASKVFGERALHECKTPQLAPHELRERIERGDDLVIVDTRTPEEYARGSLPGSWSVPGGALGSRGPGGAGDRRVPRAPRRVDRPRLRRLRALRDDRLVAPPHGVPRRRRARRGSARMDRRRRCRREGAPDRRPLRLGCRAPARRARRAQRSRHGTDPQRRPERRVRARPRAGCPLALSQPARVDNRDARAGAAGADRRHLRRRRRLDPRRGDPGPPRVYRRERPRRRHARLGRRGARRRGRPDAARRRARRRRAQALRAGTRGDGALLAVGGGPRPGRTQSEPAPVKMEPEEEPWRRRPTRSGTSSPTWTASRATRPPRTSSPSASRRSWRSS